MDQVRRFLVQRATAALEAGVQEVWADPGIGFGKTTEHNLDLLAHLNLLVAEGFTNAKIAAQLVVSRRTIDTQVLAAYRKLGVSSRVGLTRALLDAES